MREGLTGSCMPDAEGPGTKSSVCASSCRSAFQWVGSSLADPFPQDGWSLNPIPFPLSLLPRRNHLRAPHCRAHCLWPSTHMTPPQRCIPQPLLTCLQRIASTAPRQGVTMGSSWNGCSSGQVHADLHLFPTLTLWRRITKSYHQLMQMPFGGNALQAVPQISQPHWGCGFGASCDNFSAFQCKPPGEQAGQRCNPATPRPPGTKDRRCHVSVSSHVLRRYGDVVQGCARASSADEHFTEDTYSV